METPSSLFAQFGPNSGYVQELYELYLVNASLVGDSWARFFESLGVSNGAPTTVGSTAAGSKDTGSTTVRPHEGNGVRLDQPPSDLSARREPAPASSGEEIALQQKVVSLIDAYRSRGHLKAHINPLTKGVLKLPVSDELHPEHYGFSAADLDRNVRTETFAGSASMELSRLISTLERVYCSTIGFDFMHLTSSDERLFLQSRIEERLAQPKPDIARRRRRLNKVVDAETFEAELHRRYVGQKRFSLQGGETVIPMLDQMLEDCGRHGVDQVIIGMAHRGRLNVLVNTVAKPLPVVFSEFEDRSLAATLGSGDVKYHLGYQSVITTGSGHPVKVSLAPNPSHLEFVNAVVAGMARAEQDLNANGERIRVVPVLLHGEAAFVGQGVVWETLNLSRVEGYRTGGTVHIVINNQVGFTTTPDEARSTTYCTDFARGVDAPIFHVNCEDVDAACWAMELAFEFRNRYQRDVVLDVYCYRKYGHNEGDDPTFTQPVIYSEIASKKPISYIYAEQLKQENLLKDEEYLESIKRFKAEFEAASKETYNPAGGDACAIHGRLRIPTPPTGVARETLNKIASTYVTYPAGFVPHPKLQKILEKRIETLKEGEGIDWGFAESLAFGSLLLDGRSVRLSGQDCGRGTFSHRHAVLDHYEGETSYTPLKNFSNPKERIFFEVLNSTLSEAGVMGFEFGYSGTARDALVLWEGQFGDFANGAQVIIDQFLSSSEAKWNFLSGLVLLLPHGYEGQGPEHSSARLERYLQLCAEGNMVVAYPSNAGQYFHLLRRQGLMEIKRPLIVMTPKSLLRSTAACSTVDALTTGQFESVIDENIGADKNTSAVVMVTGKVYYDVIAALQKAGVNGVKVIRFEQLYPFPQFDIKKVLKGVNAKRYIWVQEEPQNMGAWSYIEPYLRHKLMVEPEYVGRPVSASTAAGSPKRHAYEQQKLLDEMVALIKSGA